MNDVVNLNIKEIFRAYDDHPERVQYRLIVNGSSAVETATYTNEEADRRFPGVSKFKFVQISGDDWYAGLHIYNSRGSKENQDSKTEETPIKVESMPKGTRSFFAGWFKKIKEKCEELSAKKEDLEQKASSA